MRPMLLRETLALRAVGLARIPMLLFVAPRVLRLDEEGCGVQMLLREARASFLHRADGDVHFVCWDGRAIAESVTRAHAERTRVEVPVRVEATVPRRRGEELVARFDFSLTLKGR